MKNKNYEGAYETGYEALYDKLYDKAYGVMDTDERLAEISASLDSICELLERFLDKLTEEKKEDKEKKSKHDVDESGFRLAKIGADIGEEKSQMDVIAKIFGNQS